MKKTVGARSIVLGWFNRPRLNRNVSVQAASPNQRTLLRAPTTSRIISPPFLRNLSAILNVLNKATWICHCERQRSNLMAGIAEPVPKEV